MLPECLSLLSGPPWSRLQLSVTRHIRRATQPSLDDGDEETGSDLQKSSALHDDRGDASPPSDSYVFTLSIIRSPLVRGEALLSQAIAYREKVSWLPGVPTLLRTQRREGPPPPSEVGLVGGVSLDVASRLAVKEGRSVIHWATSEVRWAAAAL